MAIRKKRIATDGKFIFVAFLTSNHLVQSIDAYFDKANNQKNAVNTLKKVYKELSILKLVKPTLSTIHYDTCLTADLTNRLEHFENAAFPVNVLNLKYLDNFMEGEKAVAEEANWSFLHSKDFDYFIPINELKQTENKKAAEALAHWYKIKDTRYTIILTEQNKILPRTKFENYVLGGYFQGYGILYDLAEHKVLCYFNVRINNLSNKIEDYTKEGIGVYEAMINELKSETKNKLKLELSRKLNIKESQIELGL